MNDIYLKRNKLKEDSMKLRTAKFSKNMKRDLVTDLIDEQDKIYNKYKFYDNYLKTINKRKVNKDGNN